MSAMEEPLPRGKSPKYSTFEESRKAVTNTSIRKRPVNSFFDEWLKGRKKKRLHNPFFTDETDFTDDVSCEQQNIRCLF